MTIVACTIKKTGLSYERDTTTLPTESVDYLLQNGFSQRMRDVHASVKRDEFKTDEEFDVAVRAACDRALEQIDTGKFDRETKPASVPAMVKKLGITLAEWELAKAMIDKARAEEAKAAA